MTKIRDPGSVKDAVDRCVRGIGGVSAAAIITGKSERLVAAWTDPDDERHINAPAIVKLDRAAHSLGLGKPISTAIAAAAEVCRGDCTARDPYRGLAAIQGAIGPYASELNAAMADGRIDERERRDLARRLVDVRDEIDKALAALDPPAEPVVPLVPRRSGGGSPMT